MKARHWFGLIVAGAGVALAVPPLAVWYFAGPRTSRTADGFWATYTKHGEKSIELTRIPPEVDPTRTELAAAQRLVDETTLQAKRFSDYHWATTAEGFTVSGTAILGKADVDFHHVFNPENMADGRTLDPSRPESLIFIRSGKSMELAGVMFMMPIGTHGPQPGGPLTRWHYHPVVEFCMDREGMPRVRAERGERGGCPAGMANGPTPEMMHVWLVENPYGAFAHHMTVASDDHDAGSHAHAAPRVPNSVNPYREFARRANLWVKQRT